MTTVILTELSDSQSPSGVYQDVCFELSYVSI